MTEAEPLLSELIQSLPIRAARGLVNLPVGALVYDSRQVEPGSVFFCLTGLGEDRHRFIPDACARGAAALVVEREDLLPEIPTGPTVLYVPDARAALGWMAARFHGHPSHHLDLVGVTGTNGKTTTTYFLESIGRAAGRSVLRAGTVNVSIDGEEQPPAATTPEAVDLQALLAVARARRVEIAAIEVSSHALALRRVRGCRFAGVLLTNVTQDHLDFHRTMEEYAGAKRLLFEPEPTGYAGPATTRILNLDDPWAQRWLMADWPRVVTYGLSESAEVRAQRIRLETDRTFFTLSAPDWPATEVELKLSGRYNVHNALAAAAAARSLGIAGEAVVTGLESLERVPGRVERVEAGQAFTVLVDYAHTPDALERLLTAARELAPRSLIVVFGCGGDRDRGKRPQMGRLGAELSDVCVLTSDNPRTEDPEVILDDIQAGVPPQARARVLREADRARAIALALGMAAPGDMVVIAGKGHEAVQIVGRDRRPFDDRQIVRDLLGAYSERPGDS